MRRGEGVEGEHKPDTFPNPMFKKIEIEERRKYDVLIPKIKIIYKKQILSGIL
jgi:hypothetical protein